MNHVHESSIELSVLCPGGLDPEKCDHFSVSKNRFVAPAPETVKVDRATLGCRALMADIVVL